jgi:hypothetical protein
MGCAESTFLALAITSLAKVYRPFLTFAFAGFSQNMPQKTNGVSNGSIKNFGNKNRKKDSGVERLLISLVRRFWQDGPPIRNGQ